MTPPTYEELRALPVVLDAVQAGRLLGIGRTTVYRLLDSGEFPAPALRVCGQWRVSPPLGSARCWVSPTRLRVRRMGPQTRTGTDGRDPRGHHLQTLLLPRRAHRSQVRGAACPKLRRRNGTWNPTHGTWGLQIELPSATDKPRRQVRTAGFPTSEAASNHLARIKALLGLAEGDRSTAVLIADLILTSTKNDQTLPSVEEVRRRLRGGSDLAQAPPTVGEYLTSWIADRHDIAPNTLRSYQGHIRTWFIPLIGAVRIDRLTADHVATVFEAVDEHNEHLLLARASRDPHIRDTVRAMKTIGPASKHRIRATLRKALNDALKRPHIPLTHNPACHVNLPPDPFHKPLVWTDERVAHWRRTGKVPSPVMVWTPDQTARFLLRARRDRLYLLFRLIAFKGLRRGEATGLPWAETDIGNHVLTVRFQIVQLGWQTRTTRPKSHAGDRTIALDTETTMEFTRWRRRQKAERLRAGAAWQDTGLVFTHPDGTALHPAWVSDLFHRLTLEAGLPPIRLHDLRHGAASLALAAGVDIKIVQEELGHASAAFTRTKYQSVYPEIARAAAENTARLIPLPPRTRNT